MTTRVWIVLLVAAAWLAGCGPSAQVKEARTARYAATPDVLLAETIEAIKAHYPLEGVDPEQLLVLTEAKWYAKEGGSAHRTADGQAGIVRDGAILLAFAVTLARDGDHWKVVVEPVAHQHLAGSPQPRPLRPGDPAIPGWVDGRIESLQVAIHARLKPHAAVQAAE